MQTYLQLIALMGENEAMFIDSIRRNLFINLFDTILELFVSIEDIKKVSKEEGKEDSTYVTAQLRERKKSLLHVMTGLIYFYDKAQSTG